MSWISRVARRIRSLKRFFVFYRKPEYLRVIKKWQNVRPEDIPAIEISDKTRLCKNPLVSILIATYNQEQFIGQAIDSALAQKTDFEYEILVGDDCSTDRTGEICAEYQRRYPDKIRFITADRNVNKLGGNGARLRYRARGKFVAPLEGDDYWTDPEKLQKQVDVFRRHPDVTLCLSGRETLHLDGTITYAHNRHFDQLLNASSEKDGVLFESDDYFAHPLGGPVGVAMYRRADVSYDELCTFYFRTSFTNYFILLKKGKGYLLRKPMTMYRVNPHGVWNGKTPMEQARFSYEYYGQLLLHAPGNKAIMSIQDYWWRRFRCYLFPWRILFGSRRRILQHVHRRSLSGNMQSIRICNNERCTGCATCVAICPKGAIQMREGADGFLSPVIDTVKCIGCGCCERVCPVINVEEPRAPKAVFAARVHDKAIRERRSSGGVFSILAESTLVDGGIVFGAAFADDEWRVVHKAANNQDELFDLCGSKYVQSDMGAVYNAVAAQLKLKRKVLFSGTPCQVSGLRNFLTQKGLYPSDYLLLVDVVCHAVPSPVAWSAYLKKRCGGTSQNVKRISFRRKNCGWKRYSVHIGFADGTEYLREYSRDTYMRGFLAELFNRLSCHNCPCKQLRSGSDITIADFWGVDKFMPEMDDDFGTSLVLIHNERVLAMLQREDLELKAADFDMACKMNPAIIRSTMPHKYRSRFFRKFKNADFDELVERLIRPRRSPYSIVRSLVGRSLRKLGLMK